MFKSCTDQMTGKYYNKKFGGAGFDVKHSELGTGVANKFLPSFVEIFNDKFIILNF